MHSWPQCCYFVSLLHAPLCTRTCGVFFTSSLYHIVD